MLHYRAGPVKASSEKVPGSLDRPWHRVIIPLLGDLLHRRFAQSRTPGLQKTPLPENLPRCSRVRSLTQSACAGQGGLTVCKPWPGVLCGVFLLLLPGAVPSGRNRLARRVTPRRIRLW